MFRAPVRRSAVVLTALLALAAPLLQPVTARAATAVSSVSVTDPTGDTVLTSGTTHADAPKADITAASVRYQNDFVTLHDENRPGRRPPGSQQPSLLGHHHQRPGAAATNFVSLRKGANGVVKVVMGDPSTAPAAGDTVARLSRERCQPRPRPRDLHRLAPGLVHLRHPARLVHVGRPPFGPDAGNSTDVASDTAPDGTPDAPFAGAVTNMPVTGYWAIGSDGKVYPFGDAVNNGAPTSPSLSIVDIEASPHGTGYWAVDDKGVVTNFGPVNYGSATDLKAGERVTSISGTPTGAGYWLFTNTGRAIAFGDANKNIGDVSTLKLNGEILDSAPTPTGNGYYLVGADGGVFALGDAHYQGSMGAIKLNKPVQSIVVDPDGEGYWLVASDGGVFAFKAPFRGSTGSMKLNKPMTGMVAFGNGYLMVAEDGGVFNYSDKAFSGSLGSNPPANPIVSISALG